jgi:hypothetical protein
MPQLLEFYIGSRSSNVTAFAIKQFQCASATVGQGLQGESSQSWSHTRSHGAHMNTGIAAKTVYGFVQHMYAFDDCNA